MTKDEKEQIRKALLAFREKDPRHRKTGWGGKRSGAGRKPKGLEPQMQIWVRQSTGIRIRTQAALTRRSVADVVEDGDY